MFYKQTRLSGGQGSQALQAWTQTAPDSRQLALRGLKGLGLGINIGHICLVTTGAKSNTMFGKCWS